MFCVPPGKVVVVIVGAGVAVTVKLRALVAVIKLASLTCTVKLLVPLPVGVPEITPLGDSVNPAGNVPERMLQLYGVVPPVAASVAL